MRRKNKISVCIVVPVFYASSVHHATLVPSQCHPAEVGTKKELRSTPDESFSSS
jgi:hypothetical protein